MKDAQMTIAMDSRVESNWKLVDQFNRVAVCQVGTQLLVGRNFEGCDVLLKSKSVEPRHALVEFDETSNVLLVTDLSTQNGTFVNEQRIPPASPVRLGAGDRIRFGYDSVVYHVECSEERSQSQRVLQTRRTNEIRRNSDEVPSSLSNGVSSGSPVRQRRQSVQEEEEVDNEEKANNGELQEDGMDNSEAPADVLLTNNNLPLKDPPIDPPSQVEEEKESEEEKGQAETLEKNQEKEADEEVEVKTAPTRPSQAFTIDFDALPSSPAGPQGKAKPADSRAKSDSVPEPTKPPEILSNLLPDRLRRSLREREEKTKEKERINGAVKTNAAAPALTDSRRRSTSYTRHGQRTGSTSRTRQRSASKGRPASSDRNGEETPRKGVPGRNSNMSRSMTAATQSTDSRKSRSDAHTSTFRRNSAATDRSRPGTGNVSIKAYNDGKTYLLEKMLTSQGQFSRGRGTDARKGHSDKVRAVHPPEAKTDSDSGERMLDADAESTPSEAGTYTIENEKPSAKKSKESLSEASVPNTDTSGPLHDTQEALDALEKRFIESSSRDDLDSEVQTIEAKRRPSHHQQQQNGGLLYNVLCPARPSRRTPSDHGSDVGLSKRDGSAVRRSQSENHKTMRPTQRRNNSLQHSQEQDTGRGRTSTTARRRMSTGNSSEAAGAVAISGRESASSSRKGSNTSIHSSTKPSNNISRFDYGRHSLKSQSQSAQGISTQRSPRQQQQKILQQPQQTEKRAEALEALNRRRGYNPRKAAMEGRPTRKCQTSESEGQASPDERPRRTSSADTRPMTEVDPHRGQPTHTARRGAALRRHESLNSGNSSKGLTRMTSRTAGVIPNTGSLLAPRVPASAFLDIRSPCNQRSQSVSNAETTCEVAYDLLLVSSIHVMTSKLRRGFDELLVKLRDNRVLTRTPTPIHELFQSKPPAHLNSTNAELKEALADLRLIECGLQTLDSHLVPSASDGAVSARTTTLGGCTESEYQEELKRITTDMMGFRPITDVDSDNDSEPRAIEPPMPVDSEPSRPVVHRPLPRLESSF